MRLLPGDGARNRCRKGVEARCRTGDFYDRIDDCPNERSMFGDDERARLVWRRKAVRIARRVRCVCARGQRWAIAVTREDASGQEARKGLGNASGRGERPRRMGRVTEGVVAGDEACHIERDAAAWWRVRGPKWGGERPDRAGDGVGGQLRFLVLGCARAKTVSRPDPSLPFPPRQSPSRFLFGPAYMLLASSVPPLVAFSSPSTIPSSLPARPVLPLLVSTLSLVF